MKRLLRSCASLVHSTNSNWPTRTDFSYRHTSIFDAVMPAPQRPAFFLWRVREEVFPISRGLIFLNSSAREPGMNPFRMRGIDQTRRIIPNDKSVEVLRGCLIAHN